jgi:fructosamine-3-kinase
MLPGELQKHLESRLSEILGAHTAIQGARPLSGGDINDACRLDTGEGAFFLKYNSASRYPGMFQAEARGLALLARAGEVNVPAVVEAGQAGEKAYLILDYIESAPRRKDFWEAFGAGLARMHRQSIAYFGLDHDNYIGSLNQHNHKHKTWTDFFINERLERQVALARKKGLIDKAITRGFERLYRKLPYIFPEEPPALLHGDLWSGNYMTGAEGEAVIIDPAVYYGHREMDIGMTRLFGGFSGTFYEAYNQEYAMEAGWQERTEICNLYPLMVHVNLFGGGYIASVESIIRHF